MISKSLQILFTGIFLLLPTALIRSEEPVSDVVRAPLAKVDSSPKKSEKIGVDSLTLNSVVVAATERHPLITAAIEERIGADGERLAAQGAFDRLVRGDFVDYATGGYFPYLRRLLRY